jgi:hypothetical protein
MKLSTIVKMKKVITEIKHKFNCDAYLYFDKIEEDYSIALSDVDLYWTDDFRKYAAETLESFENEEVTIINLPEKIIKESILDNFLIGIFDKLFVTYQSISKVQTKLIEFGMQEKEQVNQKNLIVNVNTQILVKESNSKLIPTIGNGFEEHTAAINNIEPFNMAA